MYELLGEHNKARVFAVTLDEATRSQIYSMLNNPAFAGSNISIMADCHAGAGSVIGFTATLTDMIIANVVGVDIGCGMLAYPLGKFKIDLEKFDEAIKKRVPSGFHGHDGKGALDRMPTVFRREIEEISKGIRCDIRERMETFFVKVGSLGGGNHFIELDMDPSGNIWLVIHTGSRNFGLQVAGFYQKKAASLHPGHKDQEYLHMEEGGKDYLYDARLAQRYASLNREMIARIIIEDILKAGMFYSDLKLESVHNYIGDDNIIRKGAISARAGERVVIPMNMSFGTVIGRGRGSAIHNFSAPHGAGRAMGRAQAKRQLDMDEFTKSMEGIFTTTAVAATLDEAPMAYKNPEEILSVLGETVDVEFIMKPIYNFKDTGGQWH